MVRNFLKELYQVWITERPSQQAAALAYYSMFAIAPIIYVAYTVAGIFLRQLSLEDIQLERIADLLGPEITQFILDAVSNISISSQSTSVLVTLIGFIALLFAASGLFFQLQFALNVIWKVPPPKKGQTLSVVRQRLFSFLIVIGLGLLVVAMAVISFLLSQVDRLIGLDSTAALTNFLTDFLILTGVFALFYKILPETRVAWKDVWLGALVAAFLVLIGGALVGIYLSHSSINSASGAAGSVAVLMVSFYYFAQIFLLGAVLTRLYTMRYGSHSQARSLQGEDAANE
jgi:membrane protein